MPTTTAPCQEPDVPARPMDPETVNDPYPARSAHQSPDGMTSRKPKDGDPEEAPCGCGLDGGSR